MSDLVATAPDGPGANAPMMDQPKDFGTGPQGVVSRWFAEIDQYRRQFGTWVKDCRKIERIYRATGTQGAVSKPQFGILWSNIETLKPAIYARPPVPVVARQFSDADPVGRAASMILRRAIQIQIEDGKVHRKLKQDRDDYLLYGRGVLWASYRPKIGKAPLLTTESEEHGEDVTGAQPTDGPVEEERLEGEEVVWDFVPRNDFLHQTARNWESVTWVGRQVFMTLDDGLARFGPKFRDVPLNFAPERRDGYDETQRSYQVFHRARVYEIWDIRTRRVIWLADGYDNVLDERDDPLGLHDFFPCPRPLYGTLTDANLVPVPDYIEYEVQAQQLDELTRRIKALAQTIKNVGAYNAAFKELARMFDEGLENELIGVQDWNAFSERNGLKGNIDFLPIADMVATLKTLIEARAQVKNDLYEITGISDVIRGAETAGPDKTATEIRTKGRYATLRLTDRQLAMAEHVRDILRITAEIVSEHFSPETLFQMCNWEQSEMAQSARDPMGLFMQALDLLKNDRLRSFRIDVEDKSTIAVDQEEEKAARVQFLEAVGGFVQQIMTIPPDLAPALAPMAGQMLMFAVRGFPVGLDVEQVIEDGIASVTKVVQQRAMQPPQPTPEMMKAEAAQQKAQMDMQIAQMQAQADMRMNEIKAQAASQKAAADVAIAQLQLQIEQIKAQAAGVALEQQASQAAAQNAQDQTEHLLKAQSAELERGRFQLEADQQAHDQAMDVAQLGLERDRLDMEEDRAEGDTAS